MVSKDNSADEVPEKELGEAEATSKDTSKDSSSVDNALENKSGGTQTSPKIHLKTFYLFIYIFNLFSAVHTKDYRLSIIEFNVLNV